MFGTDDLKQMESLGISLMKIEKQIDNFRRGFPYSKLDRPATTGDGILSFNEKEKFFFIEYFNENIAQIKIEKFVPASGAASRMFKHLFEFEEKYRNCSGDHDTLQKDKGSSSVYNFLKNIDKFAFYDDLARVLSNDSIDINKSLQEKDYGLIIRYLLSEKGLGYSSLPKALLKFHKYPDGSRVAAEEHLVEAAHYAKDRNGRVRIHFTLSPEHIGKFHTRLSEVQEKYEQMFHVQIEVSHSVQKKSTDMIAVDENNEPFRNPDGSILFRPGGHGALLENLIEIDADIVFIKNIDNVVPDKLRSTTYEYKKLIGGYLLYLRSVIFDYLGMAEKSQPEDGEIAKMWDFAINKLFIELPGENLSRNYPEKNKILVSALNRPIRICGMVKNEGEPGGGPFWVTAENGKRSLQIVESSQIDFEDHGQKVIVESSTHFNPVDLVCCIKNFKGESFDLTKYTDPNTGLIALKSSGGKTLKAQELPGLWNGAMANWITLFIEVPVITFNPVKTVNDLLRKEHQA